MDADRMNTENEELSEPESPEEEERFSKLIRYTLPGYLLGLQAGIFLERIDALSGEVFTDYPVCTGAQAGGRHVRSQGYCRAYTC